MSDEVVILFDETEGCEVCTLLSEPDTLKVLMEKGYHHLNHTSSNFPDGRPNPSVCPANQAGLHYYFVRLE